MRRRTMARVTGGRRPSEGVAHRVTEAAASVSATCRAQASMSRTVCMRTTVGPARTDRDPSVGGSGVPTVGETGAVGQATVRESSFSVVSPASTFMTPSSRMVRMPSRRAWRRISDEGADAAVSRSISSLMVSTS